MHKTNNTKHLIILLFISSLMTTKLSADVLNGTHWVIKPGDSLYKIARNVFPKSTKQQARLRKELVSLNPVVFKNGTSNISVGDKLQLPDFAIQQKNSIPVIAAKTPQPVVETKPVIPEASPPVTADPVPQPHTETAPLATTDPEDVIGRVVINVGSLSAQNRGATRQLNRRSSIYRGDTISTGGRGLTQIRLKDGALLSLRPHTEIKIAEYRYNGQQDGSELSTLELLRGGFRTITGAIGHRNKQNYKVRTSVATIGIRGTHYSLVLCQQSSCNDDGANEVEDGLYGGVADGSIVIENQSGIHRFNNDQFFKLTSATSMPVEFLLPPAILKHGAAKLSDTDKKEQQKNKQGVSQQVKSIPRRTAVILEANQPNFSRRPKIPVRDSNTPAVSEFQPDQAPNGSGMLIGFQHIEDNATTGAQELSGTATSIIITPNNNNQIFLGPNRTPIAGRELSVDQQTGALTQHEFLMATPSGTLATLVPSSVGGNATLGVNWGRWNGDFIVTEDGKSFITKNDFHYIYSENLTSPSQLATLGGLGRSVNYSLADGTLPTDNLGNVALSAPSIYMDVDFINQRVTSYDVFATVNGHSYEASANNIAFQDLNSGFNIRGTSEVSCLSGSCTGEASVLFVGPQAQGALTSYHINEPDGSKGITGTGLLINYTQ